MRVVGLIALWLCGSTAVVFPPPAAQQIGQLQIGTGVAPFTAAAIRGRVLGSDGAPTRAVDLTIEAVGPALPAGATGVGRVDRPNANGEFEIRGVSPGMYRLRARAGGVRLGSDGTSSIHGDAQTQFAVAELSVSGESINGVVLTLQEGYRFGGVLIADGSAPAPSLAGASVIIDPITNGPNSVLAGRGLPGIASRDATADDAGRFSVTGFEPSTYQVHVTLPPAMVKAGWHVDSIRRGDRDLRDAPLTFAAGSLEGVNIHPTTTVTELSGRLVNESGTPSTDYFIVAFPADRALWHPESPRIRVLRPAVDGTFSTKDLPAGAYRLAVLNDVDPHDPQQPAFLESIYGASIDVSLQAGRTTRQEIRVGRRPG